MSLSVLEGTIDRWRSLLAALAVRHTVRDSANRAFLMWDYAMTRDGLADLCKRRPR